MTVKPGNIWTPWGTIYSPRIILPGRTHHSKPATYGCSFAFAPDLHGNAQIWRQMKSLAQGACQQRGGDKSMAVKMARMAMHPEMVEANGGRKGDVLIRPSARNRPNLIGAPLKDLDIAGAEARMLVQPFAVVRSDARFVGWMFYAVEFAKPRVSEWDDFEFNPKPGETDFTF